MLMPLVSSVDAVVVVRGLFAVVMFFVFGSVVFVVGRGGGVFHRVAAVCVGVGVLASLS